MRAHHIEENARPVLSEAVELHFGQLERSRRCVLHRDNCRGVVRIDRAECGFACAHEFRGIGHHLLEQLQHLCRDIRCAERRRDGVVRVAAHADCLADVVRPAVREPRHVVHDLRERHLLDALDVHRVQLVDGDLVRNGLGQRTFAVARAAHAVPTQMRHRIQPIGKHLFGHDNGIPRGLAEGNAVLGPAHVQEYSHAVAVARGTVTVVLAHIIRSNGFRVARGDAVGMRFAAHLIRVAPHGNDNVRLALYLIAGGVAEADVRGINQLHRNIALDRLTGLKRRIKVHVEACIAVHTGVFQQRAAECLDTRAFDGGCECTLEHMRGLPTVLVHVERLGAYRHVVGDQHGHKQVDTAAQHVEDQRVERLHAQSLPLPAEVKRLVAPHTVV